MKSPLYTRIAHLEEQCHEIIFSHYVSEACHVKIHPGSHIINTPQHFYRRCQKNQQALADFCQQKHDSLHRNFLAIYKQRHFGSSCL